MKTPQIIDEDLIRKIYPGRDDLGHKNSFGHALICAGSQNMTGALMMATEACLRSGVGLVKAWASAESLTPLKAHLPCAMTAVLDAEVKDQKSVVSLLKQTMEIVSWANSVLIGPGIDIECKSYQVIYEYLLRNANNLILDAGALNLVAKDLKLFNDMCNNRREQLMNPVILTPHLGEFKRIIKSEDREWETLALKAQEFAAENNCIVVLKNYKTLICFPDNEWYIINGNNSGMAKGGSGDVLAGLITGMNAQFEDKKTALLASVYLHSEAGRIASEVLGKRFMLPTDIIFYLKEAYRTVDW